MKKKLIVANHKMNLDAKKVSVYIKLMQTRANYSNVLVCPTSVYLPFFLKQEYKVGLQNIYFGNSGSFTGEISAEQAKSVGASAVIVGHSERREHFNESDDLINKKIKSAIENDLNVILCIGEKINNKKKMKLIEEQIIKALFKVPKLEKVIIAYEPVWAIGSNKTPTNREIGETIFFIKDLLENKYGYHDFPVLYGGSVNKGNISTLEKIPGVNGYLIGGASLKDEFFDIVEYINNNNEVTNNNY